ncbi:larval cuticle protein 65Ab1-like [Teleopsis dalmanni]|uniref:larval cuticle protein 65Ab1-like n=1 Tax=Teleopsis dalmanni TaxID=139649 RepID=UPI0018CDED24|nr:larval cuticle protein 65Ab1-like [Teleopsis dalmanni]
MKLLIVFVALLVVALGAPNDVVIVKSESDVQPESFHFAVETSDGKQHQEDGQVKDVGGEHPAIVVHGSFSYKDEHDGKVYTVNYVADEHGFQPTGEHLPQLPKVV